MKFTGILAAGLVILAAPVSAQDLSASPNYGSVSLEAGFTPDPYTRSVDSGGWISASDIGGECTGYISDAPDFRLNYQAGGLPLLIAAVSEGDTTLVINNPDGSWACDDDTGGDSDPLFMYSSPQSGQYDIWIGSYESGETLDAVLVISEDAPRFGQ